MHRKKMEMKNMWPM